MFAFWIDTNCTDETFVSCCNGTTAPTNDESNENEYPIQATATAIVSRSTDSTDANQALLVVTFWRLSNRDVGPLCAFSSTSRAVPIESDSGYVAAKVVQVIPSVSEASTFTPLNSDANALTLRGTGFDSFEPENNYLNLTINGRTMPTVYSSNSSTTSIVVSSLNASYVTRTHLVLTFCQSATPPSVADPSCSLQITDDGALIETHLTWQGHVYDETNESAFTSTVSLVTATQPCQMRIRGNTSVLPCSGRGIAHDVVNESVSNLVPLEFTSTVLPVNQWTCQCECDSPNGSIVTIGQYCDDELTEKETRCFYECVSSPPCYAALKAYHSSFVASSYPNTYTIDPRSMYEDMKTTSILYSFARDMAKSLRASNLFMCMDEIQGSTSVVSLTSDNENAPIVETSSSSGSIRPDVSRLSVVLSVACCMALHILSICVK